MKLSRTLTDTKMNDEDRHYIEWIAARHNIGFLDHAGAMVIAARSGENQVLSYATSFSVVNESHTNKALYLDNEDASSEEDAYFIALHELGHTILKHQRNGRDPIENEIEAWEWALAHAQRWPNDEAICNMMDALATYTDTAESRERPDSLLALASNPDLWEQHGWKLKQFKLPALSGVDPAELIGKDGVIRNIPQPFAKMLATYIQDSKDIENHNFLVNIDQLLSDPTVAARMDETARMLGLDPEKMKRDLHRQMDEKGLPHE